MELKTLLIKDIKQAGEIISLKARVQELYPAKHPKIKQVGILSDGTDSMGFVNWTSSKLPRVQKDNHYFFEKVRINYNKQKRRLEVFLERDTKISPLSKKDIEAMYKKKPKPVILERTTYIIIILLCVVWISTLISRSIMERKARIWPKMNDVIQFKTTGGDIPFRVIEYNVEEKIIKLVSLDEYREEIEFKEKPHLTPVQDKEITFAGSSVKVNYNHQFNRYKDYVTPDISSTIIHVNSETNEYILKKLPGIGEKRVKLLQQKRPFNNLQEVMDAKIGVGRVWAEEWKRGIEKGTIIFD